MEQLLFEKDGASMEFTVDDLGQTRNADAEVVEMRHAQALTSKIHTGYVNSSVENFGQAPCAKSNQLSLLGRKHHSDPTQTLVTGGRSRFERRRIFSDTKQESCELPDDLQGQTEDNVFSDPLWSTFHQNGHSVFRRSISFPAKLDDSPVPDCETGDSPDVLPQNGVNSDHKEHGPSAKSILSSRSFMSKVEEVEEGRNNFSEKQNFEGSVCYMPADQTKRKKSVTFVHLVKISDKGKAARSRFLSSGYGSQSDGSQASQASNASSEQSLALSDEALERSFESDVGTEEPANLCGQSIISTDGNIDGSDKETEANGAQSEVLSSQQRNSTETAQAQNADLHSTLSSPGHTPEEGLDKMELWCRQMQPEFHCAPCAADEEHGVPNLSIFSEDFSHHCDVALEEELFREEGHVSDSPLENGVNQGSQAACAESLQNKLSPTTKEECQRDLFKRIIEERMLKYDHTKESLYDLLEWFKKNIGEALTPSPKSPYFLLEDSQQNGNYEVQQAVTNAVQGSNINLNIPMESQPAAPVRKQPAIPLCREQLPHSAATPAFAQPQIQAAPPVKTEPNCPNPCLLPTFLEDPTSSVNYQCSSAFSSISFSHLDQLVNISQCTYSRCTLDVCVQTKVRVNSLKKALMRGMKELSDDDAGLLKLLQEHYCTGCDLPKCSVPWCFLMVISSNCHNQKKIQQELTSLLSNPVHTMLPDNREFDSFLELDSSLQLSQMPVEWDYWMMLCPISQSLTVARAFVPTKPEKHWVIKMSYLHEEGHQLEMLQKLRDIRHEHIIKHNWVAASSSKHLLVVCTDFLPGVSLRDLLDQRVTLSTAEARHYLKQILSASLHLHNLNIVYLNWMCSNILLDQSCENLKLTNFTSSVDLSVLASGRADIGEVKLTLPADVVPAELLSTNDGQVTINTDSWGIGCILHEMLMGVRPWYPLRHLSPECIWKEIQKQIPPNLTTDLAADVRFLIQACLQSDPAERFSITNIMQHI